MNAESKLEQAAFELAQALKIIIGDIKSKPNDTRYLSSLKVGANALLKYDEVRQSLTTPAGNEVEEILKKYKTFVSNIEWHIKTNEPKGDDLKQCELRLDCYNEIVTDLERTPSKPHQDPEADKCRCSDEIKTGHTSVMCCNVCGRPDESFWITGQTQEPVKCNGNCGMNYCDEYGCIENKPEGDVSHLLTPPPSPVGIDVDSLAHSMADKWVFETNGRRWSNNDSTAGDNFDSYKNGFKDGYSASLPQSSTEEEKGWNQTLSKLSDIDINIQNKKNEI